MSALQTPHPPTAGMCFPKEIQNQKLSIAPPVLGHGVLTEGP
jgi:hypothetical protein